MADNKKDALETYRISDPDKFIRNMIRLVEEGGNIMGHLAEARQKGQGPLIQPNDVTRVVQTLGKVAEGWMKDPAKAVRAQSDLWQSYMSLWAGTMRRMAGETAEPVAEPKPGDKRFDDPDWSRNQFFDFVKQAYLVSSQWAENLVENAEGVDDDTRRKAEFYIRQIANALAPTNFVLTNPELLRETFASNGENLVRGMHMLAEDVAAGEGTVKLRQTDMTAFEVGRNLAITPGKVVFQNDIIQLIQYEAATEKVYRRPLLIVPPWINKFYVLDLTPEKSLVKWCVEQGHTVFMVSWVNPDEHLAAKTFEDYMKEGVLAAMDAVKKITGEDQLNATGYCVGGTMLAATLAYLAAKKDDRVATATFFTTQIDFSTTGDLKVFLDEDQIEAVEKHMHEKGYLEGKRMAATFNMLRSNDLIWPYVVNNYLRGKEPFPFDLLFWNSDPTRLPAANHSYYLRECYLKNSLAKGEMTLAGQKLDLSKIKIPVYSLATKEDHIAPAAPVFNGLPLLGGPVRFVLAGSGHIAGVVNPPDRKKYQYWTGGKPAGTLQSWVAKAKEHPGSWWPDWHAWLIGHNDEQVPARKPGGGKLKPIEDAPGSYVKRAE